VVHFVGIILVDLFLTSLCSAVLKVSEVNEFSLSCS